MAKYVKGSFLVVPNKNILAGKPSELQAIYFWIVSYSNESGECFPSRQKLADNAGVNIKTIDKYIAELVALGILSVENRTKGAEKLTNLYQIMIVDDDGVLPKTEVPTPKNGATPTPKNGALTISNINSINLTQSESWLSHGISDVIQKFEGVNRACGKFYGNKTQRKAVEDLITTYGQERVVSVVMSLPKLNRVLFNKATTPVELWNKWAKIEAEAVQLKNRKEKYAVGTVY